MGARFADQMATRSICESLLGGVSPRFTIHARSQPSPCARVSSYFRRDAGKAERKEKMERATYANEPCAARVATRRIEDSKETRKPKHPCFPLEELGRVAVLLSFIIGERFITCYLKFQSGNKATATLAVCQLLTARPRYRCFPC